MPEITEKLAKTIAPPVDGRRYRITYDEDVKGFGLRVTRAGARSFVLNYRIRGLERRYTIGSWPDWRVTAAREEAKRLKREIDLGRDPMGERHEERATPTLAEFSERYIEWARGPKKPRTVEEDQRNLRLHILPAFANRKITDIQKADVEKFHARRRDVPVNANRCLALLSHMFTKAEEWDLRPVGSNPCRRVKKFAENRRERFLSPQETERLGEALATVESTGSEPAAAIAAIRLLLLTGARLSEILTLEWAHVDDGAGYLRLPDSKTGQKNIPLGAPAMQLLSTLPRDDNNPYVLPGARDGGHFVGIQRVWQRIRRLANLPDLRLHDLRHSFAGTAASGGGSLYIIGKVLGHKQASTTQRYAHLGDDPVRAVADETAKKIATLMKPSAKSAEIRRIR